MANPEHVERLKNGVYEWNFWRESNLSIKPDLKKGQFSNFSLKEVNLSQTNLSMADLSDSNLSEADLRGANLSGTNFPRAILRGADFRGADLRGHLKRSIRMEEEVVEELIGVA